ncbi:hypothetical protein ACHAPJ_012609 [Fusarium lateritium]
MRFSSIITVGLLTSSVSAARSRRFRRQKKPNGTVDPGISPKCTFYDTWVDNGLDCTSWLEDWSITPKQFSEYNPSVGDNCSGIKVDHAYCVEINNGRPEDPEQPEVTSTKKTEPTPTKDSKPSPTQEGLIDTCTSFYKAKKGDTCAKVISEYKNVFDFNDFFKWNPAVDKDCSGLWADTWYCVGVPGTPSAPTRTAESTAQPTGVKKPSPTQDGLIESCTAFREAKKGDTCAKIVSSYSTFDSDTFFKWNPAVGKDCNGILAEYYYCVGVPGTPTAKPSATSPKPTATGIQTPSPIQEGIAKNCNKFHPVSKTTTCSSIENYYKLPLSQFLAWNPAVGKDCSGLWADYYVCVSVEGYKPSPTTTAKPTTTKPANGIQTPSPIQNGMVKNCERFHQVKTATTCTSIENYYKVPTATFLSWNPAVGKDCKSLLVDYWVCIATVGWKPPTTTTTKAATPTKATNGITTPSPIRPGMVTNCNKFHPVKKTTTCDSIQNYYKISLADFLKWNPAVGSNCKGLWADYNVCVGVIGGTPTKPGNSVKTPSPIQPGLVSNCKRFHEVKSTTTCDSIQKYYKITMAQLAKWNPAVGTKCNALWDKYWVCVGV